MRPGRAIAVASALVASLGAAACDEGGGGDDLAAVALAGGDLTIFDRSSNAFRMPAPNLSDEEARRHLDGDAAFEAAFVTAPAPVHAGLGPGFNHFSCTGCHPRDGRGMAVAGSDTLLSPLLVRVSLAPGAGDPAYPGGPVPVPGLGTQIQDHAVYGQAPEASVALTWDEVPGEYADGTPYTLRRPRLDIRLPDGSPLGDEVLTSPRIPSPVFGLGLLEAVPEAALEAAADPDDADGDGISGRVNRVWNPRVGAMTVGRFGWKANTADLAAQTAGAYLNDMGVSSQYAPDDDGSWELADDVVADTTFYVQTLAVPAPHDLGGADVARGERAFRRMGCDGCHTPTLETGPHEIGALAGQRFHPYTDLLLHDMGEGLADGRPDGEADGREWRTSPLWGLGLTQTVLPGATYLHDGRARTVSEAILWHGGEAEPAREAFRTADLRTRAALLAFLQSR